MTSAPEVVRGFILRALNAVYPGYLAESALLFDITPFTGAMEVKELAAECAYLREDGYIESKAQQDPLSRRSAFWIHKLLPKGKRILEGQMKDEAIWLR